jgi:hypothetical protein
LISKVMNGLFDIEVSCLRCRINIVRYRMLISYTISKVFLTFDIEGHVIPFRVRYRIRYSIHPMAFTAAVRSGSSLCPGYITPVPKSLSATCPGFKFLHRLFAHFHNLIHRDLTRKGPSIAPHPPVDFEKPAPSPAVGT